MSGGYGRRPETGSHAAPEYRALVSVTTCRRLHYLRRYLPHFARLLRAGPALLAPGRVGRNGGGHQRFCEDWEVPLVYADEREGVGISKNRVLERYPDFDYYFFLEDDVELVDGSVFPAHVELSRTSGIHHFTLFGRGGVRKNHGRIGGGWPPSRARPFRRRCLQLLHRRWLEAGGGMAPAVRRVPPLGSYRAQLPLLSRRVWRPRPSTSPRTWPTPASGIGHRR